MSSKVVSHTPALSFDGTYIHDASGDRFLAVCADKAKHLGPVFAASPELLSIAQRWLAWTQNGVQPIAVRIQLEADTRAAITKAEGHS